MIRQTPSAAMPEVTAWGKHMREYFPDLVPIYCSENGVEWKNPDRERMGEGVVASDSWRKKK